MAEIQWQERRLILDDGTEIFALHGRHPHNEGLDRPALVLLHEALGHIDMWKDFPQLLAAATGMDLLVYERRGYGRSSPITLPRPDDYLDREGRDWLKLVLDAAGLDRVVLIGHSDGGSIALIAAAAIPERVVAIITEAAHIRIDSLTTAGIRAAVELYETTDFPEKLARYHGERTDLLFRAWHETWLRDRFQPLDLSEWVNNINCPALIIQGEDDEYGEVAQVDDIVAGIGEQASGLFLPHCGHVPHLQAKTATLQAMTAFLESLEL
ncbi:alpha/beta hydrolase [Amphritea sp. 1_MG-2023]|uniref:alpha/beta fold hydrolase n=1 Tax=Amphritea sp. 1_MG-2023 TaxID=3062670 RepID=UPI0026E34869|nr:alpha/beta hydrolase [Amphritea sp. 1_MG-2023]MDO6562295.1 alpha/beta hydrolase [Amphritea sp. 1_MG-2023]